MILPAGCAAVGERLLVIGNSGSGKSTLAERIAPLTSQPVHDLDLIHWHDDGTKRDQDTSRDIVLALAHASSWVIEGVYGGLAEVAAPWATALVWTDLPWPECRDGLLLRGLRRGMTDLDQQFLLSWAEAYGTRSTPSSAAGHERLYDHFRGWKARLGSRREVDAFLAGLGAASPTSSATSVAAGLPGRPASR